ncbi:restriction endonuclease [Clostridium chromiireducens]|nr:restriction endonuclease [Clostridium chromiireducens]
MSFQRFRKRTKSKIIKLFFMIMLITLITKVAFSTISFITEIYDKHRMVTIAALLISILSYPCSIILNRYVDYLQYGKVSISRQQLIAILKSLSPRQFEYFCAELFRELGHKVYLMPDGPDGGKDVILDDKIYVECKRYNTDIIGRPICQKLLGAVEADDMKKGIIFTNGKLTDTALEMFAKTKRLELWNIDTIYLKLNSLDKHKASFILDKSLKYTESEETNNESELELNPEE